MGKLLWLDCSSGVSGDMTAAALLDAGADRAALDEALASLPVGGFAVRVGRVRKNGLDACDFAVELDDAHENRDHDMAWLHGHEGNRGRADEQGHRHAAHADERGREGSPGHRHEVGRDANDERREGQGHHEHRTLADVLEVLAATRLTPGAREIAERTFCILADAEASAHGTTRELVHFHEVGAVDSIVDVVAAAVCLDSLDVEGVVVTELAEGYGTVRCAHGVMPVPVPAVTAVASAYGIALSPSGVRGELVTPTGASIVAAVRTRDALPRRYRIERVGTGAGKRSYEGCSGVVRALVIEELTDGRSPAADPDTVVKLECDVDDCTGEALGHVLQALVDAGAREAHVLPIVTKKNRPAWQLQVLCDEPLREQLEELVFEETTTIGIRRATMQRTVLPRRADEVETPLGRVAVKVVALPSGRERCYPEHDGVAKLARQAGVSYQEAWRATLAACAGRD